MGQRIDTVVLDKTGTITKGQPEVTDIYELADLSRAALLRLAASAEQRSEHPLGVAVFNQGRRNAAKFRKLKNLPPFRDGA